MADHSTLSPTTIHVPHSLEYANATAREAATGFTSADIGRFARQTDDNSMWCLKATTPTWVCIDNDAVGWRDSTYHYFEEDFEGEDLTAKWAKDIDNNGTVITDSKSGGITNLKTGTNDNDECAIWLGTTEWLVAGDDVIFETYFRLPQTDWEVVNIGISNSAFTDGFYFRTDSGTDHWHAITVTSDTETETDTGIGFRNTNWHTFRMVASSGQVKFYINGTLEATHTTNISTTKGSPVFKVKTTAASTVREIEVDYLKLQTKRVS